MNGMDNTTQHLHYPVDEPTTQGQMTMPAVPPPPAPPAPAAPPEPATGRIAVPAEPARPWAEDEVTPAHAAPVSGLSRGRTRIADEVVERVIQKIVDLAVDEVDGVHGLHPGVERFFGEESEPGGDRAVSVKLSDEQATINLSIEVDFGYAVHEVVDQVRTTVISSAERLLGMTVAEVNVVVSDVSFSDPSAQPAADPSAQPAADPGAQPGTGQPARSGKAPRTRT